jgi:hypothetical protein
VYVVRFRVRASAPGYTTLALRVHVFIDRCLPRLLPKGYKRIRHYGLLGPAGKTAKLAPAALSVPDPDPVMESVAALTPILGS